MKTCQISGVELDRLKILSDVLNGKLTLKEASHALHLSYRQVIRLKKKVKEQGIEGLLKKAPPKPPNLKITQELKQVILSLRKEVYSELNLLHFRDKLIELHNIHISYESLRQILIKEGLHEPKRKRRIHRRRWRMPKAGLLVQMDSSLHAWIEDIPEQWWLVCMKDDADGYVYGRFYPGDTTLANMEVIKEYIKRRGLFVKLYVDKASHFKTTRHEGVHYEVSVEQKETQIGRALRELNIGIEFANSPQAKGKIERLFGFLQDRLIKELKLRGIKDYESANEFLEEEFWPWYNSRYGREAESVYRELPEGINLDLIFTVRERRKVNKDNTIRFKGEDYQLLPTNGFNRFAGKWVEVCKDTRGRMLIFWEGKELAYELIKERGDISKEDLDGKRVEEVVRGGVKQERWKPAEDHPWRRSFRLKKKTKDVTFQTGNYR